MKKYSTLLVLDILTRWRFAQADMLKGDAAKELGKDDKLCTILKHNNICTK